MSKKDLVIDVPPDWWMMKDTERQGYIAALDDVVKWVDEVHPPGVEDVVDAIVEMKKEMFIKRGKRK